MSLSRIIRPPHTTSEWVKTAGRCIGIGLGVFLVWSNAGVATAHPSPGTIGSPLIGAAVIVLLIYDLIKSAVGRTTN
jgi:hypothetical protein